VIIFFSKTFGQSLFRLNIMIINNLRVYIHPNLPSLRQSHDKEFIKIATCLAMHSRKLCFLWLSSSLKNYEDFGFFIENTEKK